MILVCPHPCQPQLHLQIGQHRSGPPPGSGPPEDAVVSAVKTMTDLGQLGSLALPQSRVTISTVGHLEGPGTGAVGIDLGFRVMG